MFFKKPWGREPNISFWVFWDAELTYSSLKAARLSVFRLFVSSSVLLLLLPYIYVAYFSVLDFGRTSFLNVADMPCIGQNMFFRIPNSRLRVITASFCHPSVLLFDGEMAAFSLSCLSACQSCSQWLKESESQGLKKMESTLKVFNSLKPLLIVPREQQIGRGYKTVIDLWKVEATAHSQVPVLNCTPALSFHEAVIIKKNGVLSTPKRKKKDHSMTQNRS